MTDRTYSKDQLDAGRILPVGGNPDQVPVKQADNSIVWTDQAVSGSMLLTKYQDLEGTVDAGLTQAGNTYSAYIPSVQEVSVTCNVVTAAPGDLRAQYSLDGSTWSYLSGIGPGVSISTTGLKDSGWLAIDSAAKTSIRVRLVSINGDGSTADIQDAVVSARIP